MSNKEVMNDAFDHLFDGIDNGMLPPPHLEPNVIEGMYYNGKVGVGMHIKKITGAMIAYVVGIMLLIGAVLMLPKLFDTQEPVGTNVTSATREPVWIGIPQRPNIGVNFKGDEYTDEDRILSVLYFEGELGEYTRRSLKADELDSKDCDVANRARDARLLEEVGLQLELYYYAPTQAGYASGSYQTLDSVLAQIGSNSCRWDIIASSPNFANTLTKTGGLLNLADQKADQKNYLDLSVPYWAKNYNDAMSYKGNYFWITGDIGLRYVGGMYSTIVNQKLYKESLIQQYGSIYDIVREGDWTLDLMTEMAAYSYKENPDTVSMGYESGEMLIAMAMSAGAEFSAKNADTGEVSLTVLNSRNTDSAAMIVKLLDESVGAKKYEDAAPHSAIQSFAQGNTLFAVDTLLSVEYYLSDMQDPYCVIPLPKYNDDDEYRTAVSEDVTVFAVPLSSQKIPQATAALEYLCGFSRRDTIPLFYENVLKGLYTRSPEAATMIDIIHDNVYGDFIEIWSENVDRIDHIFYDCKNVNQAKLKQRLTSWTVQFYEFTDPLDNAIEINQSRSK